MDDLLTPVTTRYLGSKSQREADSEPFFKEVKSVKLNQAKETPARPTKILKADDALEALKSQPDYDTLISSLQFLDKSHQRGDFNLHNPTPTSAAIIRALVTEIAPNYWTLLLEGSESESDHEPQGSGRQDLNLFVGCLKNITGLNALVAHLRALIQESKAGARDSARPDVPLHISIVLDILTAILDGDDAVRHIWTASTTNLTTTSLKKVQTQALLSILTGGKIISATAEAINIVGKEEIRNNVQWIADGLEVSNWLGRNISAWATQEPTDVEFSFLSDLFQRSLSVGYANNLIKSMVDSLVLSTPSHPDRFSKVCFGTSASSKKVLQIVLQHLSTTYLDRSDVQDKSGDATVAAVAGVIHSLCKESEHRTNELVSWCTSSSGAGLGHSIGIRRSVLAVLAQNRETLTSVLEKSLAQFGDQLYIRHAAALQQNVHVEVLLLSAGYIYRISPVKLTMLLRSTTYLSAISNRIGATQGRARFLGMVVGEALSALVDKSDKKLDFHMDETDTEEAERLKSLPGIQDHVGSVDILLSPGLEVNKGAVPKRTSPTKKAAPKVRKREQTDPIVSTKPTAIIEEIGSSEDEDEDLVPYAKGSDPDDSDEDPTVIQRNKIRPPVYIRDLISYLRDSESYEKQKLALQTAPTLIRRKANYGTEVSFHADELAGLFAGVQDKFELNDFEDLKLQGMVALIVSQPKSMAPWFARTFFEGDYSLRQRTTVLVSLGVSARQLAGMEKSEYQKAASFASKKLPEKMERLYLEESKGQGDRIPASQLKALPSTALDNIAQSLTATFLEPLAAEAADAATGPDALKLQTFTARYKNKSHKKPRVKAIPNTTASLLATSFFSPLAAHFQVALRSAKPIILNPALLGLYLQTLGVIVHAAGPSTLSLPELTQELWDLLLGVRQHALGDLTPMKGWLVAMAALLEVNEGDMRRLCETQGREVVETREWVSGVFERTRGEDGGEENSVKMLAAGVLIRLGEAIERYQALLMGHMIGY